MSQGEELIEARTQFSNRQYSYIDYTGIETHFVGGIILERRERERESL
jgi:hypothetical protein